METTELLRKVRKIEIKSRGLTNQIFSGGYQSAFKGRGMAFSEVREYLPGDEIRTIDWNVTARFGRPFVKVFEEERELTVMLIVDVSGSGNYGTQDQVKQELITEMCAVLAFSAIQNNDKIGIVFFSDRIEKFIPPRKGRSHILRIIRDLLNFEPESKGTDIAEGLRYFTNVIKKRCTAFLISDFQDQDFATPLRIANRKHDIVALNVYDERETAMPSIGLVPFRDAETGITKWVDTSSRKVREQFAEQAIADQEELSDLFKRAGVDVARIGTHESYVQPLMHLFQKRGSRR